MGRFPRYRGWAFAGRRGVSGRLDWKKRLPLVVKVLQLTTLYAALLARVGKMRSPSLEEELVVARPLTD